MFDKVLVTMVLLIALYLVIVNVDAFNAVLTSAGNAYRGTIGALQGEGTLG